VGRWAHDKNKPISDDARAKIDEAVRLVLERERARAKLLLEQHKGVLVALRDLLLEKKVLDRASFAHLVPNVSKETPRG